MTNIFYWVNISKHWQEKKNKTEKSYQENVAFDLYSGISLEKLSRKKRKKKWIENEEKNKSVPAFPDHGYTFLSHTYVYI